MVQIAPKDRRV